MDYLVVGEGELELSELARVIEQSNSFGTIVQNWKIFGDYLGLNDVTLLELDVKNRREEAPLRRLPREMIRLWKADKGSTATFKLLYDALVNCGVKEIGESLRMKFANPASVKMFLWQGKRASLRYLLGEHLSADSFEEVAGKVNAMPRSPIPIIKEELIPPKVPQYYVPRTLLYPYLAELDTNVFRSRHTKTHVFLFEGASKPEVARAAGYQAIERSGDQLEKLTARFILLEYNEDFRSICEKSTEPVHVIRHEKGRFLWVKSSQCHGQGFASIRNFLKQGGRTMTEQEFGSNIASMDPPGSISIADSPGMGKSLVLANLASQINQEQPSILLFIVLQEFVLTLDEVDSISSAKKTLVEYSSPDAVTKMILSKILQKYDSLKLILCLDGYDEVRPEKLDMLDTFLKHIQMLQNVKVIVTTRPHLQARLEALFNSPSFELEPFNETNQIEFLTSYWLQQHGAKQGEQLEKYACQCLDALEKNLTDGEKSIAGTPLLCMMLAEVFAEDAVRASKLDVVHDGVIKPISFFQMYTRLVQLKFKRIPNTNTRQQYVKSHVRLAINLLFPEWVEVFDADLKGVIDEHILYFIGLVEKCPIENTPRFIHRTFAEFLLAEFIVSNLKTDNSCVDLLFGEILGQKGISSNFAGNLKNLVIAYFIEMNLKEQVSHSSLQNLLPTTLIRFDEKDVCMSITVCCRHNLEYTFDYTLMVVRHIGRTEILTSEDFEDLPKIIIKNSTSITFLEKTMQVRGDRNILCGLFELAVIEGKYNMVSYLLPLCKNEILNLKNLLTECVKGSIIESKSVVEDKKTIVDMLVGINGNWLEEKDEDKCSPLLLGNVDFCLLKRLVKRGANINAYSSSRGTVLHNKIDAEGVLYADFISWALSSGFKLINHAKDGGITPLMHVIEEYKDKVATDVLRLFHEAGADFNAQDDEGDSVLFYAVKHSSKDTITKVLEYGAATSHKNKAKENVLHKIIAGDQSEEEKVEIMKMLVKINSKLMEKTDYLKFTTRLQGQYSVGSCLLKWLKDHGGNMNTNFDNHATAIHDKINKEILNCSDPISQTRQKPEENAVHQHLGLTHIQSTITDTSNFKKTKLWDSVDEQRKQIVLTLSNQAVLFYANKCIPILDQDVHSPNQLMKINGKFISKLLDSIKLSTSCIDENDDSFLTAVEEANTLINSLFYQYLKANATKIKQIRENITTAIRARKSKYAENVEKLLNEYDKHRTTICLKYERLEKQTTYKLIKRIASIRETEPTILHVNSLQIYMEDYSLPNKDKLRTDDTTATHAAEQQIGPQREY